MGTSDVGPNDGECVAVIVVVGAYMGRRAKNNEDEYRRVKKEKVVYIRTNKHGIATHAIYQPMYEISFSSEQRTRHK